jgi:hypothetical protein
LQRETSEGIKRKMIDVDTEILKDLNVDVLRIYEILEFLSNENYLNDDGKKFYDIFWMKYIKKDKEKSERQRLIDEYLK